MRKVDAIITADWHLRDDQPLCRTDDYWKAQWKKLQFIKELSYEHGSPVVLNAGDIFHKWKSSPRLLVQSIIHSKFPMIFIPGNHDLPQHNEKLYDKSSLNVLHLANHTSNNQPYHNLKEHEIDGKNILMLHQLTYKGKSPWPGCEDLSARELLKKYPDYHLIIIGDNHKPFTDTLNGRLLVNPGSLMRMTADQVNHKPRVYLWCAESNTVEIAYLPIESGVISREHIEQKKEREDRIEAFIEKLVDDIELDLSFTENLKKHISKNKIKKEVEQLIMECIDGD